MIWELLTGGGIAVVSGLLGRIEGFNKGVQQRNVAALFVTGQAEHLWCACEHAMSFHVNGSESCNATVGEELTANQAQLLSFGAQQAYRSAQQCKCLKFVGDPLKNPAPKTSRGELDL